MQLINLKTAQKQQHLLEIQNETVQWCIVAGLILSLLFAARVKRSSVTTLAVFVLLFFFAFLMYRDGILTVLFQAETWPRCSRDAAEMFAEVPPR